MYDEILPDLFRIKVPMPGSPLRESNAYIVKGAERNLLVDNGFNTPESESALRKSLRCLGVDLSATDFFLTHLHSDHSGLTCALLSSPDSRIFCSREDGDRLNRAIADPNHWPSALLALARHGLPKSGIKELAQTHPGKRYAPPSPLVITPVCDGDCLRYGSYTFTVLEVPGHTPGHTVLHEAAARACITGDHVLGSITPNVTRWDGVADSLGAYLRSLDKIRLLAPLRALPGHRDVVADAAKRIQEITDHHAGRLKEVRGILQQHGPLRACDVAARMRWSLRGNAWESFGAQQKCFAIGEALAHLDHLTAKGEVRPVPRAAEDFFEAFQDSSYAI